MKLPRFDADGDLPPGIHWTDWETFTLRFGRTKWRRTLLDGLEAAIIELRKAGCQTLYVDGSFITSKDTPGDFDGCWELKGVNLRSLDPVLLDMNAPRAAQQAKYHGELLIASIIEGSTGLTFLEFFQQAKLGKPKGIIAFDLRRLKL
jgi:hypothetical protein